MQQYSLVTLILRMQFALYWGDSFYGLGTNSVLGDCHRFFKHNAELILTTFQVGTVNSTYDK